MPRRPSRWLIGSSLLVLAASTMAGPEPAPVEYNRASSGASATLERPNPAVARAYVASAAAASAADSTPTRSPSPVENAPTTLPSAPAMAATTHVVLKPVVDLETPRLSPRPPQDPAALAILRASDSLRLCLARYSAINDYTCVFSKRERIDGKLTPLHVMSMKVRTKPNSVYLRFQQPGPGREAIYIDGRNNGKVLAHDIGLAKILAGTLWLDPTGAMAMEDCRHPITEAGIGPLIKTLLARWSHELSPEEAVVVIEQDKPIGDRHFLKIDTIHPQHRAHFMFHKASVHIDRDLGLPVRFEAYDWPTAPGVTPELVEEYTYTDLKFNVGLGDADFDTTNTQYAFGRL